MKAAEAATDAAVVLATSGITFAYWIQLIQGAEAVVALSVAIILGVLRIRKHILDERNKKRGE